VKNNKSWPRRIWGWLWKGTLSLFIGSILLVIVYDFVPVPVTFLMLQRCVEQKLAGKPIQLKKSWVPLNKISEDLQLSVVCSEDQNYLVHEGFDFKAIDKAMKHNEEEKGKKHPKLRGASTISQQTAKNVFLWPGRSWIRKGLEVYFTFLIEKIWSKERIMEVYLNVIEFGDGVYGAEAAAQTYLHKSAADLSPADAALMAVVLPNPLKFQLDHPSGYMRGRQGWVLRQMGYWGMSLDYDKEEELKAKAAALEEKQSTANDTKASAPKKRKHKHK
jgi:monofunctional biosynthetic peptidoglycan transglycosylase